MKLRIFTILLSLCLPLACFAQQPQDNLPEPIQLARMNLIVAGGGTGGDTTPPQLSSVSADGDDWTFTYNEIVTATDDGDMCDGYTVTMSTAGALTFTYLSGTRGSDSVFHCTSSSAIVNGETISSGIDYTQGTIADTSANAMEALDDWTTDFTNETAPAGCTVVNDGVLDDANYHTEVAILTCSASTYWAAKVSISGTVTVYTIRGDEDLTGTVYAELWTHDADNDEPESLVADTTVAVAHDSLPQEGHGDYDFVLTTPKAGLSGTYWVVVRASADSYGWARNSSCPGARISRSQDSGDTWNLEADDQCLSVKVLGCP